MRSKQLLLAAGLLAVAPQTARADIPGYTIQTLAKAGTTIGDVKIPAGEYFELGSLNVSGQLAFDILTNRDWDLEEDNPGCGSNSWTSSTFVTDNVAGASDGGPGAGCMR